MEPLDDLFHRRVVVVTGKGGTGKTSVSIALGLEAARRGKRTLIAETYGAERVLDVFGLPTGGYRVQALPHPSGGPPRLFSLAMSAESCTRDFLLKQVRFESLYRAVFKNRVMAPFIDAVPGLADVIQLGKVYDLLEEENEGPPWDLVIVDAPATGHGLSLLHSPRAMMDMTLAGPLHANAAKVWSLFGDPGRTAIVLVTLPETLPVRETLDLHQRLRSLHEHIRLCALNRTLQEPFPETDPWLGAREHLAGGASPSMVQALDLTDRWVGRVRVQRWARKELMTHIQRPVLSLPWRFTNEPSPQDLEFFREAASP